MTVRTLLHTVGVATVIISVLPILLGLISPKSRTPGLRAMWAWMIFGLAVNAVMWRMGRLSIKTPMFMQLTFPIYAALGLHTVGKLSGSPSLRRWCNRATVGYLLFWGWRFLNDEASRDFSLFTGPVLWIMLTVSVAAMIRVRLAEGPADPLRDPVLISGLAILLLYSPSAALEPVSLALFASHPDLTRILWTVRAALQLVAYLLLTMVFYWTLPPRSSPGSSSSVA